MSFVIRVSDGRDLAIGESIGTLMAIGAVAGSIPEAQEGDYEEFLSLAGLGDSEVDPDWVERLKAQAEQLKLDYFGEASWVLDRILEALEERTGD